ncbi:GerMN domain-containing protein [Paenibacillaceae sp. P-4]|uniref:GerMN domain-containing protein n=1 Tax=Paenibacillus popilliae TaxID=78057 RepID=A0ABY3AWN7_PAEPP|nr:MULTISPECIES: GerMN domain-containing protein [unclassified Paenibacillus]TQR46816.1 hypothetical protein C7Y44_03965 [Paenibacillus sp. SDF0028]SDE72797.1 Sporulation and spore germination [Paenibacillus sp. cl6col]
MKTRKWWALAAAVLSITIISACGAKPTTNGAAQPEQPTAEQPTTEQPTTEQPNEEKPSDETTKPEQPTTDKGQETKSDKQEKSLDVFVSDDQLMELKSYKKTIQFSNDDEKYEAALSALKTSDNDKDIPLWEKIDFKSVKMDKGTLVIDIHIPEEGHLGAGGEAFALDALTKTLFQFDEVKAIDILVDGKSDESLMGHVTLKHPIKRP